MHDALKIILTESGMYCQPIGRTKNVIARRLKDGCSIFANVHVTDTELSVVGETMQSTQEMETLRANSIAAGGGFV